MITVAKNEQKHSAPDKAAVAPQRMVMLDGLRAIAILLVLAFHGMGPISGAWFGRSGWIGVDIFFVISGFLITSLLWQDLTSRGRISFKNFYLRRILRLAPGYFAWIGLFTIFNPANCSHMVPAFLMAATYLSDYDLALGWGNIMNSNLEASWSLAVEEKFYLLWPLMLSRLRGNAILAIVVLIIGCQCWKAYLVCHHAEWVHLVAAFDAHFDAIMWGCLAALILQKHREVVKKVLFHPVIPLIAGVGVLVYTAYFGHPSQYTTIKGQLWFWCGKMPLYHCLTAILISALVLHPRSILSRVLETRPMVWVGNISYSLYLWSGAAFLFVQFALLRVVSNVYVLEASRLAVALAFASLSFYALEKPFMKLRAKLRQSST